MVQEVVTQSWGSRIIGAFWGCLIGLALLIGSFALVFWNEAQGLHTAQALQETAQVLISVPNKPIDPQNNLRVVYFSGLATTSEVLQDSLLGVSQQAIKLARSVEMYQWEENTETKTEKQMGGSESEVKTYTYNQTWSDHLINSNKFKDSQGHKNPARMLVESKDMQAKKVLVGAFYLPPELVSKINGSTILDLSRQDLTALQKKLNKTVQHDDYGLYVGKNPENPEVGDLKIMVSEVLPQTVSVIAQQIRNTVQPYMSPAGQAVGLLVMGQHGPAQVIQQAETENKIQIWAFRLLSLFMMFLGFFMILRPLVIFADVVPFFGSLVGFGTGLLAFAGGLILWAFATAIAWFVIRPLWSLGLMVIVLLLSYILYVSREKQAD